MKLTIELSDQAAVDILTTAVQQGCAYWANDYNGLKEKRDSKGCTVQFSIGNPKKGSEAEELQPKRKTIGPKQIGKALQRLIDTQGTADGVHPTFLNSLLSACDKTGCGADAMECDAVLQMAVFDRVIFG